MQDTDTRTAGLYKIIRVFQAMGNKSFIVTECDEILCVVETMPAYMSDDYGDGTVLVCDELGTNLQVSNYPGHERAKLW